MPDHEACRVGEIRGPADVVPVHVAEDDEVDVTRAKAAAALGEGGDDVRSRGQWFAGRAVGLDLGRVGGERVVDAEAEEDVVGWGMGSGCG